jgi:hypothetical protein
MRRIGKAHAEQIIVSDIRPTSSARAALPCPALAST